MKTTLRPLRVTLLASFVVVRALTAAASPAPEKPNILFVIADQWRAQAFGFAGDPNVQTPHLDALEHESVNCINAISGVPVCSPARASMLTGQRALTHGVFLNDVPLDSNAVTLAKVLKDAGYDTGYIGKWHINGGGRSEFIPRERRQGFDYWKALECTHAYNQSYYYADGPEKLAWKGFDAIAQTDDARAYLRGRAKQDKPFVLFLAWGPPHDPYQAAPAQYRAKYQTENLQLRPNVPSSISARTRLAQTGYYASCTALDDCMGNLMATLRDTGLAENTIVVFTADHGDLLGSHEAFNKQQPYDESIRVPLLLRWPRGLGTAAMPAWRRWWDRLLHGPKAAGVTGNRVDALINTEDIMPTLLGLCRVPIPRSVEGLDYSKYFHGGKNPSDGSALIASPAPFGQWARALGGREYRGVRTARYTYVRDLKGPWMLFDNVSDPYQLTNLVNDSGHASLQAQLDAILERKLKTAHDEFLPASAYIAKWGYKVDATGTVPYTN